VFNATLKHVAVSFIGGGNRTTRKKNTDLSKSIFCVILLIRDTMLKMVMFLSYFIFCRTFSRF